MRMHPDGVKGFALVPSLLATLGANISPFIRELLGAKAQAKKHGEGIGDEFTHALQHKLAEFASIAAIEQLIEKTIAYGAKVEDTAQRLGMSTTAIQEWDFALKQNGSSIEAAAGFFEKLGIARGKALKGNEEMIAAFGRLGISIEQLKKERVEDIAAHIGHAFEGGDPQALVSSLREVGGKGAGEMIATLSSGFAELAHEAHAAGTVMSESTIDGLKRAEDAIQQFKAQTIAWLGPLVGFITDIFREANDGIRLVIAGISGWFNGIVEGFSNFSLKSPWKSMFKGFATAAKDSWEYFQMQGEKIDQEREARELRLAKRKKAIQGDFEGDGEDEKKKKRAAEAAAEKAAAAWRSHMERLVKLEDENRKKQEEADLARLSRSQKLLELQQRYLDLTEQRKKVEAGTEADLELEGKQLDIEKQMDQVAKDKSEDVKHKAAGHEVNSLQKMGIFLGSYSQDPQISMLDVQKKSERHLEAIRRQLSKAPAAALSNADVEF